MKNRRKKIKVQTFFEIFCIIVKGSPDWAALTVFRIF